MIWGLLWAISNLLTDQHTPDFMKPKDSSQYLEMLGTEPCPGLTEFSPHLYLSLRSIFKFCQY
jgi:hypothetical protein